MLESTPLRNSSLHPEMVVEWIRVLRAFPLALRLMGSIPGLPQNGVCHP